MSYTSADIDVMENWWVHKSQRNFLAYRKYMRHGLLKDGWFTTELCRVMQNFYADFKAQKRPVYIVNTPPQHGKSWSVSDLISWVAGDNPFLKIIYASYTDRLGKRCNKAIQRTAIDPKYKKIFPDINLVDESNKGVQNSELIETWNTKDVSKVGFFRNTTVNGAITGDTMDIGIIDDPVKGRKEARSPVVSQTVWEWFEDDFDTRLSEYAGILIIMTRWVTHDLTARIKELNPTAKIFNFQALATKDEEHRKAGEPLFPELKSKEFLEGKKQRTSPEGWESLYQGNPTVTGGNIIKDDWWGWWLKLPPLEYKFITADTAQKDKKKNDFTVLQCWGYGIDGRLYLLDKLREKMKAPTLRREAELFYKKHNTPRLNVGDPILRGMYIEDKSSGTGLIQELRAVGVRVVEVPRNVDKYLRVEDATPFIKMGLVILNTKIPGVDNLTKEGREFPSSEFDDDLDTLITAIEITYINKNTTNSLEAAMGVDN